MLIAFNIIPAVWKVALSAHMDLDHASGCVSVREATVKKLGRARLSDLGPALAFLVKGFHVTLFHEVGMLV